MRGFRVRVAGATALVLAVGASGAVLGPAARSEAASVRRAVVVAKRPSKNRRPAAKPPANLVVVTPVPVSPITEMVPVAAPAVPIDTMPVVSIVAVTPVVPPPAAPGTGATADALAMLEMVNSARASQGLGPLAWDDRLGQYGLEWSQDMSVNGFRHRNLSTLNQGPGVATGENITRGSGVDVPRLHQLLLDSPGHRANIMSTRYKRIGIGIYRSGNAMWITQEFGS